MKRKRKPDTHPCLECGSYVELVERHECASCGATPLCRDCHQDKHYAGKHNARSLLVVRR